MKLVQAYLGAKNFRESTFHHCGGPAKLVQGFLSAKERTIKQFSPQWRSCEDRAGLFKCQERSRKPF